MDFLFIDPETGTFFIEFFTRNLLLVVFVILVLRSVPGTSASWRHTVWAASLAASILMPISILALPDWHVLPHFYSPVVSAVDNGIDGGDANANKLNSNIESPSVPSAGQLSSQSSIGQHIPRQSEVSNGWEFELPKQSSGNILLIIWGAGVVVVGSPVLVSFVVLHRLTKNTERPRDKHFKIKLSNLCTKLGIDEPFVIIGSKNQMPLVWQFRRSYLLLPRSYQDWNDERTESVLLHELAHLCRRDPLSVFLGQISRSLNWFNPMVWYAFEKMRAEQEIACDDVVVGSGLHADKYATHLLELSMQLQSRSTQGIVALSMAVKSKIEYRLTQILEPELNRAPVSSFVTITSTATVFVFAIFLCVVGFEVENSLADEFDPTVKWPFCELKIDSLERRSIESALIQFNEESKVSPIGSSQAAITVDEFIQCLQSAVEDQQTPAKLRLRLSEILKSKELPADTYLRRFTRFDDGDQMHGVWWVRLIVGSDTQEKNAISIRQSRLYSRPYTLLEREQIASKSLTLLNRVSSYYEKIPEAMDTNIVDGTAAFATEILGLLNDQAKKQLMKKFNSNKVSSHTQKFVESEFAELIAAKITSVEYVPVRLKGTLITWKAFHRYKPNLPVDGYLRIQYQEKLSKTVKRKHLEVGRNGRGQLFFVGYSVDRRLPLPKEINPPMAIASQMFSNREKQPVDAKFRPGNSYYQTWKIDNPGKLLSAHLANEEIWLREANPDVARFDVGSTELVMGEAGGNELRDVVWGKPSRGLKAAVKLAKNDNANGFDLSYYVMNISEHEIRFDSETWRQNDRFQVWTDGADRIALKTHSVWVTGWPMIRTHILLPGQFTKLSSGKLIVRPRDKSSGENQSGPYIVVAGPGKYQIQFELNIPGFAMQNDHWKGIIETGLTPFEIE